MKIRLAIPDEHLSPEILDPAIEAITRANEVLLRKGKAPLWGEALRRGVRWQPEPFGQGAEHFDLATEVIKRGWGDCDDVAPYKAASLRVTGEDPGARAIVRKVGPGRWHAYVLHGDGTKAIDPSREAGMGRHEVSGSQPVQAAIHTRAMLATVPWRGGVAARADLPWAGSRYMISGHGYDASPGAAMDAALRAAIHTGDTSGAVHPDCLAQAVALRRALAGGSEKDIRRCLEAYGLDVHKGNAAVGSLWGSIKKRAKALAHPLARAVSPHALVALAESPAHLVKAQAHAALGVAKALARGRPLDAVQAIRKGTAELTRDPAWRLVQDGASLFPGAGTTISAGMATAAALGRGMSLRDAALAAARAALPPGVRAGFDIAYGLAHGQSVSAAALAAAREQLPESAKGAFDAGLSAATKIAPSAMPRQAPSSPFIVRL